MSFDTIEVMIVVAGAMLFVARRARQAIIAARRPAADGCGSDCGCGPGPVVH
jgi:hypothetical protein